MRTKSEMAIPITNASKPSRFEIYTGGRMLTPDLFFGSSVAAVQCRFAAHTHSPAVVASHRAADTPAADKSAEAGEDRVSAADMTADMPAVRTPAEDTAVAEQPAASAADRD